MLSRYEARPEESLPPGRGPVLRRARFNQVKSLLAKSPPRTQEWEHVCDKGNTKALEGNGGVHMYHCAQQGRAYATHTAVLGTAARHA